MGMICPECGEWSAKVGGVTADGRPPRVAGDVIACKLSCGHTAGGQDYQEYLVEADKIREEARTRIIRIEASTKEKTAAIWREMAAATQEVEENAE